jgi:hypothetical protein
MGCNDLLAGAHKQGMGDRGAQRDPRAAADAPYDPYASPASRRMTKLPSRPSR